MSEASPSPSTTSTTVVPKYCQDLWCGVFHRVIALYLKDKCGAAVQEADMKTIFDYVNPIRRSNQKVEKEYSKKRTSEVSGLKSLKVLSSPICFLISKILKGVASANEVADHLKGLILAEKKELKMFESGNPGLAVLDVDTNQGYVNFLLSDSSDVITPRPKKAKGQNKKVSDRKIRYPKKRLTIEMMPSSFLEEEFDLFCKYQTSVHNDEDLTPEGYKRFLVETPIQVEGLAKGTSPSQLPCLEGSEIPCDIPKFQGFGAFHQQYRIDGKLVAVGVVDLIRNCLSSKYFFWDPEYAFLELGKISSFVEIDFVKQAQLYDRHFHYYYQGYYVHTCPKMAYKAEYKPAELLCPTYLRWVDFDDKLRQKMEEHKGRMNLLCDPQEGDGIEFQKVFQDEEDMVQSLISSKKVHDLKCMIHGRILPLKNLLSLVPENEMARVMERQCSSWMASCGVQTAMDMIYQIQ